jgi:hypothetical protein
MLAGLAMNVALSGRREDAVRAALVKSGANAEMLVAKGYGSADPIASNDTPDGRLRNRRIEYRFLLTDVDGTLASARPSLERRGPVSLVKVSLWPP